MDDIVKFVDLNSQPNSQPGDSSGPTSYFLPNFITIEMLKPGTSHYEERLKWSIVGGVQSCAAELGRSGCSNASSHNWLKLHRPKVATCPHQEDTYDRRKAEISAKQTMINHMLQLGDADPVEETP